MENCILVVHRKNEGPAMKKLSLFILPAMLVLSGCDADGNLGMEGSPAWFNRTTPQEQAAYFSSICQGYGIRRGTRQMTECIAEESRSARAQGAANLSNAIASSGNQIANSVREASAYTPPTTYRRVGNSVYGSDGTICRQLGSNVTCY